MPGTDQVDDRALSASHELKLAVEGRKALVDLELVLQQRVEALELGVLPQELGFVAYLSARPTIRPSISNIAPICFRCPRVLPRMPPVRPAYLPAALRGAQDQCGCRAPRTPQPRRDFQFALKVAHAKHAPHPATRQGVLQRRSGTAPPSRHRA